MPRTVGFVQLGPGWGKQAGVKREHIFLGFVSALAAAAKRDAAD